MSPSQTGAEDIQFWGYRERARALLRHLILERGLCPSHPTVTAFDHHLYLGTAHQEFSRVADQAADLEMLRTACFRGCDLRFRYCDRVASPLADADERDGEGAGRERRREEQLAS